MTTDTRELADFTSIAMEGHGDMTLVHGETPSIVIEADAETLEHLRIEVVGGKLHLGMKNWLDYLFYSWKQINYKVTYRNLNEVSVSGSGKVRAEEITSDNFRFQISGSSHLLINKLTARAVQIHISGSGDIDLSGTVQQQEIHISGSAKVEAWALDSQTADVRISGSGDIMLKVSETLNATISGSGSVRYMGSPKINQSISGSGSIKQVK